MVKVISVCSRCGKDSEVDENKSTKDWTVYKEFCNCGGRTTVKVV